MTSQVTKDDLRQELYLAGVRDPRKLERALRTIEAYVYGRIRNAAEVTVEVKPEPVTRPGPKPKAAHKTLYKCRKCSEYYDLNGFPEAKRISPGAAVDCLLCGGVDHPKLYKCTGTGMCNKEKPLGEFPARKQEDTSLRTPCSWCDKRRVTVRDAR